MPVVEVSCPGCGAKLKAPDNMAGKKAKCKKCGKGFRIPGPSADSIGGPQVPSVLAAPPLPGDEDTEVMMAEAADVEATLPLPTAPPVLPVAAPAPLPANAVIPTALPAALPAKDVSVLPSADPFDFSKPAPAPAAKPAFGSAKAAPTPPPAKPKPPAASAPPPPAKAKPAPEPLPLDDDDFQPIEPPPAKQPVAKAAPAPEPEPLPEESDNPFSFSPGPEKAEKPAKTKRRDEEAEKPAKSKRRDEDEEEQKPRKKRKDEEEPPARSKEEKPAKEERVADAPFNPFADFDPGPAEEPEKDDKPAKSKRRDEDEEGKPRKKRKGDEDEPEEPAKPRYRRPEEQGGLGKMIALTAVIGLFAIGLAAVAGVVYVKNARKEKEREQEQQLKKDEKKDETPGTPPVVPPPEPPPAPPKVEPKPKDKNPEPKPKDKEPEPKPKDPGPKPKGPEPKPNPPDPGPALTRPAIGLPPKLRAIAVGALPEKPELADQPRAGAVLEAPLASVRHVFPPFEAKADTYVLIQTNAGFNGKGERLALDSYGPVGNRVPAARIEYDGDGSPAPLADVHASREAVHFLAATGGKLHVWSVLDKQKKAEGLDPYAEKPEHAKAGMAAAFFSAANPKHVVTVSTAGAVLLFDWSTNKVVSEFVPPDGAPGKVSLGLSAAKADGGGSVAVALAGSLYQVKAAPGLEVMRKYDLGGDVGRSLGLAASGTPGRLLYAFETAPDKAGKKEKAILVLPLGAKATHILYGFPATVGEPKGALWAGGVAGGVVMDKGVLWFDDDEGRIVPMVFTQPGGAGLYLGDDKYFWYVVAHPKEPGKSVMVALSSPFNDFSEFLKSFPANQPLRAVKIDGTGLSK